MRILSALVIGMIFGIGIAISGMANPAKVLNFFDIAGSWDPSLIFVMGGALITTAIGYRLVFGTRSAPLFEGAFVVPGNRIIDRRLVLGSATFGIGWGISGFCPGGAIPALGLGYSETFIFVGAMIGGMLLGVASTQPFSKQQKHNEEMEMTHHVDLSVKPDVKPFLIRPPIPSAMW